MTTQLAEGVRGVFGAVNFPALGGLAHGLARQLVGLQVEGELVLVRHSGQNDADRVRNGETHAAKHGGSPILHFSIDSGTDNRICSHEPIVAQMSYDCPHL